MKSGEPSTRRASRHGRSTGVVLAAQKKGRGPEEIVRAALPGLVRRLTGVCRWSGDAPGDSWDLGDYRFGVLEFSPAEGATLFVQWWSEPAEQVIIEVCSGHWNTAARPWITREARRHLRERGFTVGGRAKNFQKHATVRSRADIVALAREALDILVQEFRYDGRLPLTMESQRGTRAEPARVHHSLTPEEIVKLVAAAKLKATLLPAIDAQPTVAVHAHWPFTVSLSERVKTENLYTTLVFSAPLVGQVDEDMIGRVLLAVPGAQVVTQDDGRRLQMTVQLDGGVTTLFLFAALGRWLASLKALGEPVDALLSAQPRLFETSFIPTRTVTH